ncbi:folate-binding protein [Pilimelia columellifera]|uniref:Folate-binding protein YgfZ n=1 Tax=Pilimelia columellifera subsp. columellifera TaxID=706583 RepID=A0ABN3NF94_9ACTN
MIEISGAVPTDVVEPDTLDQPTPEQRAAGVGSVAAHYGDPTREQRTLERAVGVVDRSHRGVLVVAGAERASWLHSLTTQHVADLLAGQGTELLVLSPNGHVEQHAMVAADADRIWLDTEPGRAGDLLGFLEKMRFLTRVEPSDVTADFAVLSLVGPEVDAALAVLGVPTLAAAEVDPAPGPKFPAGTVRPGPTSRYAVAALPAGGWARRGRLGVDLLVPRADLASVVDTLAAAGVPACGLWAYEALRVAARIARVGFETDHRTIAAEVDLLGPAVHLDKGCYRGQETVARVHNMGRPPRRLALLHLDGVVSDTPPPRHAEVIAAEGRVVGFVGTAVRHHELGMIALAVIKRNVPGDARLTVAGQAAAIDPGAGD